MKRAYLDCFTVPTVQQSLSSAQTYLTRLLKASIVSQPQPSTHLLIPAAGDISSFNVALVFLSMEFIIHTWSTYDLFVSLHPLQYAIKIWNLITAYACTVTSHIIKRISMMISSLRYFMIAYMLEIDKLIHGWVYFTWKQISRSFRSWCHASINCNCTEESRVPSWTDLEQPLWTPGM